MKTKEDLVMDLEKRNKAISEILRNPQLHLSFDERMHLSMKRFVYTARIDVLMKELRR